MNISQTNFSSQVNFAGKKLPRYLYHMTTVDNYKEITKSGMLKVNPDKMTDGKIAGIFVFDLKNFIKHWDNKSDNSLGKLILDYISNGKEMVLLQIPIKSLGKDFKSSVKTRAVQSLIDWKFDHYSPGCNVPIDLQGESLLDGLRKSRKKNAVEFIIQKDVPVENINVLGRGKYLSKENLKNNIVQFVKGFPMQKVIR